MSGRPGMGPGRPGGPGRGMGPMGMMGGMPVAKSKDFRAAFRRLLGHLRPEAPRILLVMVLAVGSVAFAIIGPKLLGEATNIIYAGVVGRQLPAGMTQEQVIALMRSQGQGQLADMLAGMQVTPGAGVDFTALAQVLVLLAVLGTATVLQRSYLAARGA